MIHLSNGHSFEFAAASGALGFSGKGWRHQKIMNWILKKWKPELAVDFKRLTKISKTILRYPKKGHPWAVRFVENGTLNAIALDNPGVARYCVRYAADIKKSDKLIVSIGGYNISELLAMVRLLNRCDFVGIEYNASCSNISAEEFSNFYNSDLIIEICKILVAEFSHPLLLKLNYLQDFLKIARALEGIAQAISLNSIPFSFIYPLKKSPLEKFGGGAVSGKIIQPYNWEMAEELEYKTNIPVIWSSIYDLDDIQRLARKKREIMLQKCGPAVQAISFGSVFLKHFWRINSLMEAWKKIKESGLVPENSPVYAGQLIV